MPTIGYHASHEQFSPAELLAFARHADGAGFEAAMCSDHFFPWTEQQGQSGFAWSWLGAAMEATELTFGTVTAPGQRYHPAIIAQAAATLSEMYPERFWLAVGTGQFLNEHITGDGWPRKPDRRERLRECVDIMRALWDGGWVTHDGHVVVEDAHLYSRPENPPMVVGAAITAETARWVGSWADALITVARPRDESQSVIDAFRAGGGEGKPAFLQVQISYAPDESEALHAATRRWGANVSPSPVLSDLRLPSDFEELQATVSDEEVAERVLVSSEPGTEDVERSWVWGRSSDTLRAKAEDDEFDLIVLGRTGAGQVRRALLGTTAERLVRNTPCSLYVVGAGE